MNYTQLKSTLLSSMSTSFALQDAIKAFDKRDVIDALRDAETLVELLKLKLSTTN